MAYFANSIIDAVDQVARIYYIDYQQASLWNRNRRGEELRLLTGWCWMAKGGSRKHQQGLKTMSAAYRDAYYALVQHQQTPAIGQTRTRASA